MNNGIARRSWSQNKEAKFAINRAMKMNSNLKVTIPYKADEEIINNLKL